MNPIAMTVILVVTLSIFAWSAYHRFQLLRSGASEPEFDLKRPGELAKRIEQPLLISFGQQKMAKNEKYRLAGIAHIVIFARVPGALLNSILLWFRGYDAELRLLGPARPRHAARRRLQLRRRRSCGVARRARLPACSSTTASSRARSA